MAYKITATTTPQSVSFEDIFGEAYKKRTLQIVNKGHVPVEIDRDTTAVSGEGITLRQQDSSNTITPSETFNYISVVTHSGTADVVFMTW